MSRRANVVGAVLGAVGAAGAAGAVAVAEQQRRRAQSSRRAAAEATAPFGAAPSDRTGHLLADDDVSLYYEEVGPLDAPLTVVFVHGYCLAMGEYHYQRLAVTERFGDDVRVLCFDQRSHGRSGRSDPAHTTVDQVGRDLATVLAERVPDGRLVLVGHSMGGMTIMALAEQDPALFEPGGRVGGVTLISTSSGKLASVTLGLPAVFARVQTPLLGAALRFARSRVELVERGRRVGADLAWAITRRMSFGDPQIDAATLKYVDSLISATRVDVVADFFPSLMHHDKAAALVHLRRTDVEVICGDHDLMLPLAHSKAIADALPDARLTVVEGAGHIVVLERPDVVDAVICDQVARVQKAMAVGRAG